MSVVTARALARPASRRRAILLAPIALAFADASIVVLALPQIVARLHTSVSSVVLVIVVYNAALIVGALAVWLRAGQRSDRVLLIGGLLVFGAASLGSGLSPSLHWLLLFRAFQGLGGGVLLCGSLPQLAAACRRGESALAVWASTAAVGAALGPAAGGLLTQAFDWRAIFLAQAPVAGASALAVWLAARSPVASPPGAAPDGPAAATAPAVGDPPHAASIAPIGRVGWVSANVALALLSAGLIGALFMVTLLLINVWGLTPLAAAALLTILPALTGLTDGLARGRPVAQRAAGGAIALGVGLLVLSAVSHRELGLAIGALVLCGAGLGLAFPALTDAAMDGGSDQLRRVSLTVAARDAGLVLGLLVLTPIFVGQLNRVPRRALPPITRAILTAPAPTPVKLALGLRLLAAEHAAPPSALPDLGPPFTATEAAADPATRAALRRLRPVVHSLIVSAATRAFRTPLLVCAIFALLVLPALALRAGIARARPVRA